jgi:deazaflavin-dependent oxidoreductase (nitroreductase family)
MGDSGRGLPMSFDAKDAFVRFWSTLHEATFRVTEGKVLNRVLGMEVVRLTTTGRRSGAARSTMLTAPLVDGEQVVLVASNGGDARDPQWYRNVSSSSAVEVTTRGATRTMRARVATGDERQALWRRIREVTPVYERYQAKTGRLIPVVVLEPSDEGATILPWPS